MTHSTQSVGSLSLRQAAIGLGRLVVVALWLLAGAGFVPAHADLFSHHEVTVQLATKNGKPMGNTEVRVFGPGQTGAPTLTGHTDADGKFNFEADRDGFWSAEARNGDEVARVSIRVGGSTGSQNGPLGEPVSPYWVFAGLGALLVLAFSYRVMRLRARRRGATKR